MSYFRRSLFQDKKKLKSIKKTWKWIIKQNNELPKKKTHLHLDGITLCLKQFVHFTLLTTKTNPLAEDGQRANRTDIQKHLVLYDGRIISTCCHKRLHLWHGGEMRVTSYNYITLCSIILGINHLEKVILN